MTLAGYWMVVMEWAGTLTGLAGSFFLLATHSRWLAGPPQGQLPHDRIRPHGPLPTDQKGKLAVTHVPGNFRRKSGFAGVRVNLHLRFPVFLVVRVPLDTRG